MKASLEWQSLPLQRPQDCRRASSLDAVRYRSPSFALSAWPARPRTTLSEPSSRQSSPARRGGRHHPRRCRESRSSREVTGLQAVAASDHLIAFTNSADPDRLNESNLIDAVGECRQGFETARPRIRSMLDQLDGNSQEEAHREALRSPTILAMILAITLPSSSKGSLASSFSGRYRRGPKTLRIPRPAAAMPAVSSFESMTAPHDAAGMLSTKR